MSALLYSQMDFPNTDLQLEHPSFAGIWGLVHSPMPNKPFRTECNGLQIELAWRQLGVRCNSYLIDPTTAWSGCNSDMRCKSLIPTTLQQGRKYGDGEIQLAQPIFHVPGI
mmetsp:Transcript_10867/g.67124  ORF Transcript_10867/g.67124 Transcript_10867/m.67124 type:complete len:111 (+) Transcript_10867:527-859(+)